MTLRSMARSMLGVPLVCSTLLMTAACAPNPGVSRGGLDPVRKAEAVKDAKALRARGGRVWCVPFARTASGIDIHGDARTWWRQAADRYDRGHQPEVGAVMAFRPTHRIPLGHVAVVSKVVSPRIILVDQANWHRNRVSLNMAVMDVSKHNDWSAVRVESFPDRFGAVYPVTGFISAPAGTVPHISPPPPALIEAEASAQQTPAPQAALGGVTPAAQMAIALSLRPELRPGDQGLSVRPELRPGDRTMAESTGTESAGASHLAVAISLRPHLRPRHYLRLASAD